MKYIFIIIILLFSISCDSNSDDCSFDELKIMNTVCIDGILNFSIVDNGVCFYAPVSIEGEIVRCKR